MKRIPSDIGVISFRQEGPHHDARVIPPGGSPTYQAFEHGRQPACITLGDTILAMAKAISVRLDDDAVQALRALEAAGMTRSEAIRSALVASARRLRSSKELAAEVAALEADDADRDEMVAVAELMEALRGTR